MPVKNTLFGTDLRLLRNLAFPKSNRDPGSDLSTTTRQETRQVDLATLTGVDNLVQALFLRFLTPRGDLELLGHPDYGSRLFELIGKLNTETNRNRAKLYVLQALASEPRVKEVLSVRVTQDTSLRTRIDIEIALLPIESETVLNLVFPFFLDGGIS